MPTDLTPHEVSTVTEAVNSPVADAFALYVKTKNFHWRVYGQHLNDYHHMFDKQAEDIIESIDGMVERVRKIGGTTIRSIGHISQPQMIEDDNEDLVSQVVPIRDSPRSQASDIVREYSGGEQGFSTGGGRGEAKRLSESPERDAAGTI